MKRKYWGYYFLKEKKYQKEKRILFLQKKNFMCLPLKYVENIVLFVSYLLIHARKLTFALFYVILCGCFYQYPDFEEEMTKMGKIF